MEAGKRVIDQAILRLVSQHAIPDQASLIELLALEGFRLTQGTLSRRMARLSVQKRNGRYQRVADASHPVPPYAVAQSSPNLMVLQTHQGLGPALALRVDRTTVPGILGTVAGEDALFIAIHGDASIDEVREQVALVLGPPQLSL